MIKSLDSRFYVKIIQLEIGLLWLICLVRHPEKTKLNSETTMYCSTEYSKFFGTPCISFEAIVSELTFTYSNTLAVGLHQVMEPEMGVILRVTDGKILIFSFDVVLQPYS